MQAKEAIEQEAAVGDQIFTQLSTLWRPGISVTRHKLQKSKASLGLSLPVGPAKVKCQQAPVTAGWTSALMGSLQAMADTTCMHGPHCISVGSWRDFITTSDV
jgi:hypothetical protein